MSHEFESAMANCVAYVHFPPLANGETKEKGERVREVYYLPLLPMSDVMAILQAARALRVAAAKESLIEWKVPALEAAHTLTKYKSDPIIPSDAYVYVQTMEGADAVLAKCMHALKSRSNIGMRHEAGGATQIEKIDDAKIAEIRTGMSGVAMKKISLEVCHMVDADTPERAQSAQNAQPKGDAVGFGGEGGAVQNPPEPKGFPGQG